MPDQKKKRIYFLGTYDDEFGTFQLVEPELLIQLYKPFEGLRKVRELLEALAGGEKDA